KPQLQGASILLAELVNYMSKMEGVVATTPAKSRRPQPAQVCRAAERPAQWAEPQGCMMMGLWSVELRAEGICRWAVSSLWLASEKGWQEGLNAPPQPAPKLGRDRRVLLRFLQKDRAM
ncbi:hypothetical protein L7F22_015692, partial [Adiantum nelumboides]|nr:hypothetical protein [Adiantum nelumboides]